MASHRPGAYKLDPGSIGKDDRVADEAVPGGPEPPRRAAVLRRLLPLLVLLLGLGAFFALGLHRVVTFEALREHRATLTEFVGRHYLLAILIALVGYALAVAFSLPIA